MEDPDVSLVDLWANLLVSASENYNSYHAHFVSIISKMSPQQGDILMSIINTVHTHELDLAMDNISMGYASHRVRGEFELEFDAAYAAKNRVTDDDIAEFISQYMSHIGVAVVHAAAQNVHSETYFDIDFDEKAYTDNSEIDFSILESLGLIRRVDADFFENGRWMVLFIYYHLTTLGQHFAVACKIVTEQRSQPKRR